MGTHFIPLANDTVKMQDTYGRNKEWMGTIEGCINSIIEAKAWILVLSRTALGGRAKPDISNGIE